MRHKKGTCPNCGHCPTCGRSDVTPPYYGPIYIQPYPYPNYPPTYPYNRFTYIGGVNVPVSDSIGYNNITIS